MNANEAGRLLAAMAVYDNRKTGNAEIVAWLRLVGDLDYADCETAVLTHYAESRERIMPADVRTRVRAIRRDRLEREITPAPPAELADDTARYRASLAASLKSIADGRSVVRALRPAGSDGVPGSFTEARKRLGAAPQKLSPREIAAQQAADSRREREVGKAEGDPAA